MLQLSSNVIVSQSERGLRDTCVCVYIYIYIYIYTYRLIIITIITTINIMMMIIIVGQMGEAMQLTGDSDTEELLGYRPGTEKLLFSLSFSSLSHLSSLSFSSFSPRGRASLYISHADLGLARPISLLT